MAQCSLTCVISSGLWCVVFCTVISKCFSLDLNWWKSAITFGCWQLSVFQQLLLIITKQDGRWQIYKADVLNNRRTKQLKRTERKNNLCNYNEILHYITQHNLVSWYVFPDVHTETDSITGCTHTNYLANSTQEGPPYPVCESNWWPCFKATAPTTAQTCQKQMFGVNI